MDLFVIDHPAGGIRCAVESAPGRQVLIAAHGFGSSALSNTNRLLMQTLP